MLTCPACYKSHPDGTTSCDVDGHALQADPDLQPGQFAGEYQIVSKIGEGGFGAVYRAVHPLIGKAAAVKVLNHRFSADPQMVSRFMAEARSVNQIRHRNIIDIFSFGQIQDGRHYFVMEHIDGRSLDRILAERGRLPVDEALPLLRGLTRALAAAHAAGIAHRDLKPENVLVTTDDDNKPFPKLIDFGIAKLLGDTSGQQHKTDTGAPMGTSYYMSPEQCRGRNIDHRTDIYACGILVHVMLTGKRPFEGDSVMDILMKQLTDTPPRISQVSPDLPPDFDAPVLRMLSKDPADRPPTITEAYEALEAAWTRTRERSSLPADLRPSGVDLAATEPALELAAARTLIAEDSLPPGPPNPRPPAPQSPSVKQPVSSAAISRVSEAPSARTGPDADPRVGTLEPNAREAPLPSVPAGAPARSRVWLYFAAPFALALAVTLALTLSRKQPSGDQGTSTAPVNGSAQQGPIVSPQPQSPSAASALPDPEVRPAELAPAATSASAPRPTPAISASAPRPAASNTAVAPGPVAPPPRPAGGDKKELTF